MSLTKQQRGCWILFADAPPGTSMSDANAAINAFVAEPARGLLLFHDHFADRPGGTAVFDIEEPEQLAALQEPGPLEGWTIRLHPLIFAGGAQRFLFQIDYTMSAYRGRRLQPLWEEYAASDLKRRVDDG